MAIAKEGDTVLVEFTGKLVDGTVFDTTINKEPLEFTLGESKMITGFKEAVVGMHPGESKTARIPVEKAYGQYNKEMVFQLDRSQLGDMQPKVNQHLKFNKKDGNSFLATVTEVSPSSVTLDANNPLAGKDLIFDITLKDII